MRGTKLYVISSLLLIITGLLNLAFGFGILELGSVLSTQRFLSIIVVVLIIQGIIAILSGIVGIIDKIKINHAKLVMILAWASLLITYLLFFLSYGNTWYVVFYTFICVIISIVNFIFARRVFREFKKSEV